MKKMILENVRIMVIAIILSLGFGVAYAWNGPTSAPPSNTGISEIINTGSVIQTKNGPLWVNSLGTNGVLSVGDKLGVALSVAPVERLEVNGNAKISGNANAGAFLYSSDFNLKKNIKPLGSELDKVLALQPVSFDWKSDNSSDIGFIAQEVEKIFPEVVHTNPNTNLKSIDYPKLTVFLVQALQEQQKEIELLKANK